MAARLEDLGRPVVVTREPGGTPIGENIRHLLIQTDGPNLFPETELLLFAACRAQLVREIIGPALEKKNFVLCDRFLDSTTVYQGIARCLPHEPIQCINRFAAGHLLPDLTVVIDIPEDVSRQRVRLRATSIPDRLERETITFYKAVREGYVLLAESYPERFILVDGTQSREEVAQRIWVEIEKRFLRSSSASH
jgi:dTMP kinase